MDESTVQETPVDDSTNEPQDDSNLTDQPQVAEPETTVEPEQQEEQTVPTPEVPEATVSEEEDEDYVPFQPSLPPQELNVPEFDLSQIQPAEDGTLDANSLAQAFNAQVQRAVQAATQNAASMVKEAEERRIEENMWRKAQDKYPELKQDKDLAKEVQALRYGMFLSDINAGKQGRMLTPAQAYDRLSKRLGAAKTEGVRQATESVRVQESAYVEPSTNASTASGTDKGALFEKMRSPDRGVAEAAQRVILKNLLFGE